MRKSLATTVTAAAVAEAIPSISGATEEDPRLPGEPSTPFTTRTSLLLLPQAALLDWLSLVSANIHKSVARDAGERRQLCYTVVGEPCGSFVRLPRRVGGTRRQHGRTAAAAGIFQVLPFQDLRRVAAARFARVHPLALPPPPACLCTQALILPLAGLLTRSAQLTYGSLLPLAACALATVASIAWRWWSAASSIYLRYNEALSTLLRLGWVGCEAAMVLLQG